MWPRHGHEIDGCAIFAEYALAIALVVAEAVLYPDNDPIMYDQPFVDTLNPEQGPAYHKLVKTTPKPRATKNNNGELVGPPPLLPLLPELVALGIADVVVEDMVVVWELKAQRKGVARTKRCEADNPGGTVVVVFPKSKPFQ